MLGDRTILEIRRQINEEKVGLSEGAGSLDRTLDWDQDIDWDDMRVAVDDVAKWARSARAVGGSAVASVVSLSNAARSAISGMMMIAGGMPDGEGKVHEKKLVKVFSDLSMIASKMK